MSTRARTQLGFTIIELFSVIVILCVLATLVGLAYGGVQTKDRNNERQTDIDTIKGQLEAYFASTTIYPSYAQLADPTWRAQNIKRLPQSATQDPQWTNKNTTCTQAGKATLSAKTLANCYSFVVTGDNDKPCDNATVPCYHYTLTATLEGGETYSKTSLN